MKKTILLLSFFICTLASNFVLAAPTTVITNPTTNPTDENLIDDNLGVEDFLSLTPRSIKKATGKKLSVKEIVQLKVAQKAIKKSQGRDEMSGKTIGIIAHITLIGWIIAFIKNNDNKTELGSFYVRQVLGLMLTGLAISLLGVIPILGWILGGILGLILFIFAIISFIGALKGEEKLVPILGKYYQEWFSGM